METQVSLVHIPGDSILDASDIIDVQDVADFLRSIGDMANKTLPGHNQVHENHYEMPFTAFTNLLLAKQPGKTTTNGGAAEWTSFPVVSLLAQGLWPIMMKIAEKQDLRLGTESDVLQIIAPITERLLNIGIILRYGTPEIAAQEFFARISTNVVEDARCNESIPFAKAVQLPVAKFFGDILKSIASARQSLVKELREIDEQNRAFGRHKYIPENQNISGHSSINALKLYVKLMDHTATEMSLTKNNLTGMAHLGDSLMIIKLAIKAARLLPAKMSDFSNTPPRDSLELDPYLITEEWLLSQILLAVGGRPAEQGSIGSEAVKPLTEAAHELSDSAITQKLLARFKLRGAKPHLWPIEEKQIMDHRIMEMLNLLRSHDYDFVINRCLVYYDFTAKALEGTTLTPKKALDYAMSPLTEVARAIRQSPETEQAIMDAIAWKSISLKNITTMIDMRNLSAINIARGITLMAKNKRQQAAQIWITECRDSPGMLQELATPDAVAVLKKAGLLHDELSCDENISSAIPAKDRPKLVRELLVKLNGRKKDDDDQLLLTLFTLVNQMDDKEVQKIFGDIHLRPVIYSLLLEYLLDPLHLEQYRVPSRLYQGYLQKLGITLTLRFILAAEIFMRGHEYNLPADSIIQAPDDDRLLPWKKLSELAKAKTGVYFPATVDPTTVTNLMKKETFSEEAIFRWIHANDPKLEANLKKYLKARDRYYRIIGKK